MMNKALTQEQAKIINFIKKYPDSITDRRRFAALIADIIPDNKPLKNAIILLPPSFLRKMEYNYQRY